MIWRGIIILFVHFTVAVLIWAGYSWIQEDQGLNPLIAFPGAAIMYIASWLWIAHQAAEADVAICSYLEWLESREEAINDLQKEHGTDVPHGTFQSALVQIKKSLQWWEDRAS